MDAAARKALLDEVAVMVNAGELSLGDAVRVLRSAVLGMDRQRFAKAVKVSPRALATLEDDADANPTLETVRRVLKPFGGALGLVFPKMSPPSRRDESREELKAAVLEALARNRRRPKKPSLSPRPVRDGEGGGEA